MGTRSSPARLPAPLLSVCQPLSCPRAVTWADVSPGSHSPRRRGCLVSPQPPPAILCSQRVWKGFSGGVVPSRKFHKWPHPMPTPLQVSQAWEKGGPSCPGSGGCQAEPSVHPSAGPTLSPLSSVPREGGSAVVGRAECVRAESPLRSLGCCPLGVPSPPFQAWTAAAEGGGGTEGEPTSTGGQSRPWGGGQLEGWELPEHQGQPHRRGTLQGPQCPWDFWSLESSGLVTTLSGVSGLLLGAVVSGSCLPQRCPPHPPSLLGLRPAAWVCRWQYLVPRPPSPGPHGATCSCPDPPGRPFVEGASVMPASGCDPRGGRPVWSTAGASANESPECGEPAPAAGEMALEAEPAPNPIPGPAGGKGGGRRRGGAG